MTYPEPPRTPTDLMGLFQRMSIPVTAQERTEILAEFGTVTERLAYLEQLDPPAKIADEAIGLFLEFRDQHAHDEDQARMAAVEEVREGTSPETAQALKEINEAKQPVQSNNPYAAPRDPRNTNAR